MKKLFGALLIMISGQSAFGQLPSYVPTSGLGMFLPFNGNTNDASGNGNNATVFGCTPVAGKGGVANTAYKFDGSTNYMKVANSASVSPSSKITLYAKIKPQGFYNGNCRVNMIMSKGFLTNGSYGICFQPSNNYANSCAFVDSTHENYNGSAGTSGTPYATLDNAPFIQKEQWDDVVLTFDSSTVKVYVNTVKRFQVSYSSGIGTNAYDLLIGKFMNPGYEYWFNGVIDEIGIWNRPLTACEINRLYYGSNTYIAAQPTSQMAKLGNNAVFTVSANVPATAARYRWQSNNGSTYYDLANGGQYSGVSTNTLTVAGVTPANAGQLFRCIVSDTTGCPDTTAVVTLTIPNLSVSSQKIAESYLGQNSPNPFSHSCQIDYYLSANTHQAEIVVTDVVGRKVMSLPIAGKTGRGSVSVEGLPEGAYCYALLVNGIKVDTKKMQVVY